MTMRALFTALILSMAAALPALAQDIATYGLRGLKGEDDRILVEASEYPWSAIGRFNKRTGGHCTAALVGDAVAITSAHCLWNKRTYRFLGPESVVFVGGWNRGEFIAASEAERILIPPDYDAKSPPKLSNVIHDWAIVLLKEPVGRRVGTVGVTSLTKESLRALNANKTVFVQAGYSTDKKHVITAHVGCFVQGWVQGIDVIQHQCDAVPGDSGSPVFMIRNGRVSVVALHAATGKIRGIVRGFAVPVTRFAPGLTELGVAEGHPPADGSLKPLRTTLGLLNLMGRDVTADPLGAISAFQAERGLPATGEADHETHAAALLALGRQVGFFP
jgi:protease YdgD